MLPTEITTEKSVAVSQAGTVPSSMCTPAVPPATTSNLPPTIGPTHLPMSTTGPGSQHGGHCKFPGCQKPCYVEGQKVHEFCGRTHASAYFASEWPLTAKHTCALLCRTSIILCHTYYAMRRPYMLYNMEGVCTRLLTMYCMGALLYCCNAVRPSGPVNTRPTPPMPYSTPRPAVSEMMRYATPPSMASSNTVQPPGQPPVEAPPSTSQPPHFQTQVGAPPSPTLGSSSRVSHVMVCNMRTYLITGYQ